MIGVATRAAQLSGGRLRPPAGWAAGAGGGAVARIGFTVSLLIAALAFDGAELVGEQDKPRRGVASTSRARAKRRVGSRGGRAPLPACWRSTLTRARDRASDGAPTAEEDLDDEIDMIVRGLDSHSPADEGGAERLSRARFGPADRGSGGS